jgi:hypothetical protein
LGVGELTAVVGGATLKIENSIFWNIHKPLKAFLVALPWVFHGASIGIDHSRNWNFAPAIFGAGVRCNTVNDCATGINDKRQWILFSWWCPKLV